MYEALALIANPTIRAPSTNLWGSFLRISLSLQVPGSLSSAFMTRYDGLPSGFTFGMKEYLRPL